MKLFLFDCGTRDPLASVGLLVLRAGIGLMMAFGHGLPKLQGYSEMLEQWNIAPAIWPLSYMSKPMSLMMAIGAEFVASLMLVLGVMTRPAAFMLGFAMCVAAFQVHALDPFFSAGGAAKEMAVLYLLPAFVLIITGAGQYSIDAGIATDKRRRRR